MAARTKVEAEEALERVTSSLGSKVGSARLVFEHIDVTCEASDLVEVVRTLRDRDELAFTFFTFLCGIDRSEYKDDPGGLEVLVHLYSPEHVMHINIHVAIDADKPECPTITGLFRGAEWQERECHEMFGIDFPGHGNLGNLFLPEDFEGHPLLRSFKLPSRATKDWPGAKDPEEAAAGGRG